MRLVLGLPLLLLSACLLPRSAQQAAADEERGQEIQELERANARALAARELAETRRQMEAEAQLEELERRLAAMTPEERESLRSELLALAAERQRAETERLRVQKEQAAQQRAEAREQSRCDYQCRSQASACRSQCLDKGNAWCGFHCNASQVDCARACTE